MQIVSLIVFYVATMLIFLIILALINRKFLLAKWRESRSIYRVAALRFWGLK